MGDRRGGGRAPADGAPAGRDRPPAREGVEPQRVVVGVVGKPFGIRGGCYVRPDPDVDHDFAPGTRYPVDGDGLPDELEVADRHDHGDRMVLRFTGVDTREAAERLRAIVLTVDRAQVRLDEEWLWADAVLGAEVVDDTGAVVGVVEGIDDGPAHDYLVVARPDAGAVWIPAVDELVTITRGRVVVASLPGLLDPAQADAADAADAAGDEGQPPPRRA